MPLVPIIVMTLGGIVNTVFMAGAILVAYESGWDDGRRKYWEEEFPVITKAQVAAVIEAVKEES